MIPVRKAEPQTLTPPAVQPVSGPVHTIASGESLYVIARKYGVKPDVIVKANDLASMDKIYIGQKLVIPGGKVETTRGSDGKHSQDQGARAG